MFRNVYCCWKCQLMMNTEYIFCRCWLWRQSVHPLVNNSITITFAPEIKPKQPHDFHVLNFFSQTSKSGESLRRDRMRVETITIVSSERKERLLTSRTCSVAATRASIPQWLFTPQLPLPLSIFSSLNNDYSVLTSRARNTTWHDHCTWCIICYQDNWL